MKQDITSREDIDLMIKVFYDKLLSDPSISYIFTDVAKIHIETHLPVIVNFWESILFNSNTYQNNPMRIHLEMAKQTPLLKHHFETWLTYFNSAVDELFEGTIAFKAKERALSIATVMQIKIHQQVN